MSTIEDLKLSISDFQSASSLIYKHLSPTPQLLWPLLSERCGCEVWTKHENHLPTGSFKVRGGIWYIDQLINSAGEVPGVVAATRGNHGQSVAFSAQKNGIKAQVVIPFNNSHEKNRAMRGYGAELIEHGEDFNVALEYAKALADKNGLHLFPSFHPLLVQGVGTYSLEFLQAVPAIHTVYVPIGLGSGICGMIAARNALNLKTEIVGVVSEKAPAYALSYKNKQLEETASCDTMADGLAVRIPNALALESILQGVARVVTVSDEQIIEAIQIYYADTHNIAEGAGASPLAALLKERARMKGKKTGLVLSGGNLNHNLMIRALRSEKSE
jgi:threonine dehydratase